MYADVLRAKVNLMSEGKFPTDVVQYQHMHAYHTLVLIMINRPLNSYSDVFNGTNSSVYADRSN